ncbi:MAG: sigma 54-interacting transcriptional regulator [Firmicutes bacterium]|nr:sigma 54-interacting transcriptional regulator [Bacillota bacterium]
MADGGTLFLDELNSMDIALQPKILKVIEEGKMRRLGSEKEIHVDVRFIAAMNVEPEKAINQGLLRADLYYRLNIIPVQVPPLRQRQEDIEVMMDYFISVYSDKLNKHISGTTEIVRNLLLNHPWKGNVRELKNVIEYAVGIAGESVITMQDLPDSMLIVGEEPSGLIPSYLANKGSDRSLKEQMDEYEKSIILHTLRSSKNVTSAARKLKLTRQALQYKMDKHCIEYGHED